MADWEDLEDLGHMCSEVNETLHVDEGNPRGLGCYLGGRKPKVSSPSEGWSYPWSPCVEFNQSFWNGGEPNNKGECETCLAVKYESEEQDRSFDKLSYMLNDMTCDVKLPFICALKRCDKVGCDLPNTCKTMGDKWAKCSSDWSEAVGYKCDCNEWYEEDKSGTCIPKHGH